MRFFILVAYIFQVVLTVDVLLVSMKSKNILALIFSALFLSEYLFLRAYVLYITDVVSLEEDGPAPLLFFFGVVDDFCFKCCFTPSLRSSLLASKVPNAAYTVCLGSSFRQPHLWLSQLPQDFPWGKTFTLLEILSL